MEFFQLTTEWMEEKYNLFNKTLFNNALGGCRMSIFTQGNGKSYTLGHFGFGNKNGRIERSTRRLFVNRAYYKEYAERYNIVDLLDPYIELNGNYQWTEPVAENTLVHEMCHYYTYKDGYAPIQGHGREFKEIASIVAQRSNGEFTIQRFATAEEMSQIQLDDNLQKQKEKRIDNKMQRCYVLFLYYLNGEVMMLNMMNFNAAESLLDRYLYYTYSSSKVLKILGSDDMELKSLIFSKGYTGVSRTGRGWYIHNKPILNEIMNGHFKMTPLYHKDGIKYNDDEQISMSANTPQSVSNPIDADVKNEDIIPYFAINTMKGNKIVFTNVTKDELYNKLKEKFPRWSDENIMSIVNNPRYREKRH